MKKLPVFKILLTAVSVIFLNACSKSNDVNPGPPVTNPRVQTQPAQTFELEYVIRPLTSDIVSISFNDENGIPTTVYDMDYFPSGTRKLMVSADNFKARLSVVVSNMNNHPIGFRLEIRINGQPKQSQDFIAPTMISNTTASVEYGVRFK